MPILLGYSADFLHFTKQGHNFWREPPFARIYSHRVLSPSKTSCVAFIGGCYKVDLSRLHLQLGRGNLTVAAKNLCRRQFRRS
jgi:hypothetical protein